MNTRRLLAAVAFAAVLPTAQIEAQAWAYPSFQPPRVVTREYNFGIADSDRGGVSIVFQWREQSAPSTHFGFDLGIADSEGREDDIVLFGGIGIGHRLGAATNEVPLDFLLTGGLYLAVFDGGALFRLPVGVSLGHRFDLGDGMALTPYLHPRLSIDVCNDCGGSDIGLVFDLGASFQITRSVSIRGAAVFGGDDTIENDAFGISLAWTPPSLARRR
jgi:hypothetical protein